MISFSERIVPGNEPHVSIGQEQLAWTRLRSEEFLTVPKKEL
jgi:hypothetical protein